MDWARAEIPGAGKGLSLEQPGNSRACQCVIGACVDQFSNLCQSRRPWGTDCSDWGARHKHRPDGGLSPSGLARRPVRVGSYRTLVSRAPQPHVRSSQYIHVDVLGNENEKESLKGRNSYASKSEGTKVN